LNHKVARPSSQGGDAFDLVIATFIVGVLAPIIPIYTAARSVPAGQTVWLSFENFDGANWFSELRGNWVSQ
jgi:hypothetical protein